MAHNLDKKQNATKIKRVLSIPYALSLRLSEIFPAPANQCLRFTAEQNPVIDNHSILRCVNIQPPLWNLYAQCSVSINSLYNVLSVNIKNSGRYDWPDKEATSKRFEWVETHQKRWILRPNLEIVVGNGIRLSLTNPRKTYRFL